MTKVLKRKKRKGSKKMTVRIECLLQARCLTGSYIPLPSALDDYTPVMGWGRSEKSIIQANVIDPVTIFSIE